MNGVHTPSPNSVHFLDKVAVQLLAEGYGTDVENLRHELHQVKRGTETSLRLLEFTRFLKHFELVFSELFRLCKIAVTISVINAAFERSFSTLKIVKTHLRYTMTDNMLSNLSILSIEFERTKSLDKEMFVRIFLSQCKNRRTQLI